MMDEERQQRLTDTIKQRGACLEEVENRQSSSKTPHHNANKSQRRAINIVTVDSSIMWQRVPPLKLHAGDSLMETLVFKMSFHILSSLLCHLSEHMP